MMTGICSFQLGVGLNNGRPSNRLLMNPIRLIMRTDHPRFKPVLRALRETKKALMKARKEPPATARQAGGAPIIFSLGHNEMATKMRPTKTAPALHWQENNCSLHQESWCIRSSTFIEGRVNCNLLVFPSFSRREKRSFLWYHSELAE